MGVSLSFPCSFTFEERDSRTYFLEIFEANEKARTSRIGSLHCMRLERVTAPRSYNTKKQVRESQVGSSAPNIPKQDID